mmetsp:Transcript_99561/g.257275  ORF Transcript_99561/g.257275 Transcript_99561/m.257275 type:complete len:364 (+) Transcript_99561:1278-2369(+)
MHAFRVRLLHVQEGLELLERGVRGEARVPLRILVDARLHRPNHRLVARLACQRGVAVHRLAGRSLGGGHHVRMHRRRGSLHGHGGREGCVELTQRREGAVWVYQPRVPVLTFGDGVVPLVLEVAEPGVHGDVRIPLEHWDCLPHVRHLARGGQPLLAEGVGAGELRQPQRPSKLLVQVDVLAQVLAVARVGVEGDGVHPAGRAGREEVPEPNDRVGRLMEVQRRADQRGDAQRSGEPLHLGPHGGGLCGSQVGLLGEVGLVEAQQGRPPGGEVGRLQRGQPPLVPDHRHPVHADAVPLREVDAAVAAVRLPRPAVCPRDSAGQAGRSLRQDLVAVDRDAALRGAPRVACRLVLVVGPAGLALG